RWQGENVTRFPKIGHSTVTLKKGTMPSNTFLADWLTADPPSSRAVTISLCDEAGAPVGGWHIKEAIPGKPGGSSFDATSNEVAFETIELQVSSISVGHV